MLKIKKLNAGAATRLFKECCVHGNERTKDVKRVPAITGPDVLFDPGRLNSRKGAILELLSELPSQFHAKSGGGDSLARMNLHEDGTPWTESTVEPQHLALLAMAIDAADLPIPRSQWCKLEGGQPLVTVRAS